MRILVFVDALDAGGTARFITTIANGLSSKGHEVMIASNFNRRITYNLDSSIIRLDWYPHNYYELSRINRLFQVFKRGRGLIKNERPDVIISAAYHIIFLSKLCGLGLGIPFVFSDQTSYARKDSPFTHFIRWYFYELGDAVTVLTENDVRILGKHIKKKVAIHNPLSFPINAGNHTRNRTVLAVGHTDRWRIKGLDLLIKSWGMVSSSHPDWKLLIMGGESEESKAYLMQLAKQSNVDKTIVFGGFCSDMNKIMQSCSLFALSSRIEGFALVLTESLSQGLPVVSFEVQGVIREVSGGGKGTLLVEDGNVAAFANAMATMMDDNVLRFEKSKEGIEFVQKYSVERIIPQWEDLLTNVIERRRDGNQFNNQDKRNGHN